MIDFKGNWDYHLPLIAMLESKWLHMRFFMGDDADLLLDGLKLVKQG